MRQNIPIAAQPARRADLKSAGHLSSPAAQATSFRYPLLTIPTKVGIHLRQWVPAFAGMTGSELQDHVPRTSQPAHQCPAVDRPLSIESQHGAGDFAGFHGAEGFVDVAETAALGDHRVEVEPALAEEIEIERDVGSETGSSPCARSAPCIRGGSPSMGTRSSRRAATPRRSSRCRGSPGSRSPAGTAWRGPPPRKRGRRPSPPVSARTALTGSSSRAVDEMRRAGAHRHLALDVELVDRR